MLILYIDNKHHNLQGVKDGPSNTAGQSARTKK
jgi:hypothetical protein